MFADRFQLKPSMAVRDATRAQLLPECRNFPHRYVVLLLTPARQRGTSILLPDRSLLGPVGSCIPHVSPSLCRKRSGAAVYCDETAQSIRSTVPGYTCNTDDDLIGINPSPLRYSLPE
jgi:hypothetical protein